MDADAPIPPPEAEPKDDAEAERASSAELTSPPLGRLFLEELRQKSLWVVLFCSAVAGSAIGVFVLPRAPSDDSDRSWPEVRYLGAPLSLAPGAVEEALKRTRARATRSLSLELPDGKFHTISLAKLGAEIDTARLSSLIADARDPKSDLRRLWADLALGKRTAEKGPAGVQRSHDLPTVVSIDPDLALSELLSLKDRVDRSPQDARLDLEKKTIIPEVVGRTLDVDGTLESIAEALEGGQLAAKAVVLEHAPKRRKSALQGLSFERILGRFETHYSRAERDRDRTYNLHLAASKLDGTVLLPGEIFDFNEVVGARDEANGYRVATVIADGELVDGIGGGTCQISGTLHGAAFFAGLSIVERYPHTRPSSYIKMGMDATVVYPTINFRVQNPFSFPIVLHQTVQGGIVRAEVLGPELDQVVTLVRRIDEALPYEQIERPDADLPRGTRVLAQRGIPGFRLHRYRITRQGAHTLRERWRDVYPPTTQVVRVGTGPADKESKAKDVATPEYLADELLVLTLKRPESAAVGEFAENREAGRFGRAGWTEALGMPYWRGSL